MDCNKELEDISLNRFRDVTGFVLCKEGYADVKVNEMSGRLEPKCVLVLTPLVRVHSFKPSENYEEISYLDDLKIFYPIFHLILDTKLPLFIREMPIWKISDDEYDFILQNYEIFKERQDLIKSSNENERVLLEAQLKLIKLLSIVELIRNHIKSAEIKSKSADRQTLIAYNFISTLHQTYKEHRSVTWYANEANLSPGHFNSIVKNVTGLTPSQWIETITINYAKRMLETTAMSIKEIAHELNFPEQFTFRKYFKQHAGVSPKEYRNQIKNQ